MSTVGATSLTLADWAKRLDPDGKTPKIVELLAQTNEVLADMQYVEGNLPTGHRTTVRTALPTVSWRRLNEGVTPSKSTTAQQDEGCGMLNAWSEVDIELANLNGNSAEFRLSEGQAFIEAMNQEMAQTLFYGNAGTAPQEFTGFAPRYADITGTNAQNMIDAGGAGSDNTSIWFICWGANTVHGIFPKGSKAGLEHKNHGEQTIETVGGSAAGTRMRVFQDEWIWKTGLVVRDWRYAVRIGSIDVSNLVGQSSQADLFNLMIKAIHRIPSTQMGTCAFYMNRTVHEMLDIQTRDAVQLGGQLKYADVAGHPVMTFRGFPCRKVDAIVENETAI